jgi:hypothetical protein
MFLYITFERSQDGVSYYENAQEQIIRTSKVTGRIIGVTIPNFTRRAGEGEITVPELENPISGVV